MISAFAGKNRFLSNFYKSTVTLDNMYYPSVECAYQAAKTLRKELRLQFTEPCSAAEAKKQGRKLKCREDWELVKESVMLDLLRQKFQDPKLRQKLIDTYGEELVEGNWWQDFYWGICNGKGQNRLGKLLMQVRDEILSTEAK